MLQIPTLRRVAGGDSASKMPPGRFLHPAPAALSPSECPGLSSLPWESVWLDTGSDSMSLDASSGPYPLIPLTTLLRRPQKGC